MRIHLREVLEEAWSEIDRRSLVLVGAPGGSGKSTLVRAWREPYRAAGGRLAWLTLSTAHRDPVLFVEDCIAAVREALPEPLEGGDHFGTALLRAMPRTGQIRAEAILPLFLRELRVLTRPIALVLDAYEHLDEAGETATLVDLLLRAEIGALHVVVTTRGVAPRAAPRLIAEGRALEVRDTALNLRADQMRRVLADEGVVLDPIHEEQLLARTEGWAIAVRFAARALAGVPPEARPRFIAGLVRDDDLFRYIAHELIGGTRPDVVRVLEIASVLGPVERPTLATAIEGEGAADAIDDALAAGLLQSGPEGLGLHELLSDWIRLRLVERLSVPEWSALHARLGRVLEASGRDMAALRVYRAAALEEPVAALLGRCAHDWVNRGQYALAGDALADLPAALRRSDPRLRAVEGILAGGRDPDRAFDHLREAVEMYRAAGNRQGEFEALHELGIIAMNENRMDEVTGLFRYALDLRGVLLEPELRGMVFQALGSGLFVAGRYAMAQRVLRVAETYDRGPREQGGLTLIQSSITFFRGEWDRTVALVEARCADEDQRLHGASYFAMQARRCAVLGLRGIDVEGMRETLREAADMFVTSSQTLNLMHCEIAHGQVALREGDLEDAIERFRHASALGARIRQEEGEVAAQGFLARALQRYGALEEAERVSGYVVDRLARPALFTSRFSTGPFWAPAAALGAVVHAELGDAVRTHEVLEAKRKTLVHRELPLCQHTLHVCHARVAERAGKRGQTERDLRQAAHIRRVATLRDYAPEIDDALLEFAQSADTRGAAEPRRAASVTDTAPRAIRVTSFGGLELWRDERAVSDRDWRGETARRLFVRLLAAEGRPVARERLEADLWPDAPAKRARANLRVALSRLRDVLEPRRRKGATSRFVDVRGERVAVSAEVVERWDVTRWRKALEALQVAISEARFDDAQDALDQMRALRPGELLPESLEDWTLELRRSLDEEWLQGARDAAEAALDGAAPRLAAGIAAAYLSERRDDERIWELLVRARGAEGDRSGALRAIEDARTALRGELDLDVSPALDQLEKQIRDQA